MTTNIIEQIAKVTRRATDVEQKLVAATAGAITVGGVTTLLNAVGITDAPQWLVLLITVVGTFAAGYFRRSTVTVSSTDGSSASVDVRATVDSALGLPTDPAANVDLDALATHTVVNGALVPVPVGSLDVGSVPEDDDAPKHAA